MTESYIVDMDSHVLEPPDLWENYLASKYQDRGIFVRKNHKGIEELIVDNEVLLSGRLASLGGVDHNPGELFIDPGVPYLTGCPPASYDTQARIQLLDEWGVDAGVVFPTIGILWDKQDDPELAMAYAQAYNNWQWDFAAPALARIIPIAQVPLYDVDLAHQELDRCLKLGFRGMFLAPEPVNGKRPSHPDFDPLWQLLSDADLPVCIHLIVRFNRSVNAASAAWWDSEREPINTVFAFGLGGTMQLMPAVSALVCDGLFDRFPKLKVAVVESGAGYVSYLMDRLDEKYDRFRDLVPIRRRPSEYIRENFWFVMDPSERGIDAQCDLVGEDRFLWGSDYPHIDSHADAMKEVHTALAGMVEARRHAVLGGNAQTLFAMG
jgi:predicted TIM-barrel fold metal-dependent hydrolase